MATPLNLEQFQELVTVVQTLTALLRQIIASKTEDTARISELTAQVSEQLAVIEGLGANNENANSLLSSFRTDLDALIAEAAAAIPGEPTEPVPVA